MTVETFRFADWLVSPASNAIVRDGVRHQIEPRAMDVLCTLCERANTVVSTDELLLACWGSSLHGDNPVHKTITQLRQALGDNAKAPTHIETIRKRGYRTIAAVIHERNDGPAAGSWRHKSPFRGLEAFGEDDAAIFFGRDEATRRLRETVDRQSRAGRALTLLLGPSGCGKTSLVRAGLLPALQAPRSDGEVTMLSYSMFDLADVGIASLFTSLGAVLLDWQIGDIAVLPGYSSATLGAALEHDLENVLGQLRQSFTQAQSARLVLFIDRFEAVFTGSAVSAPLLQAFLRVLDGLARSGTVLVLLACRNDFYPRIAELPLLMEGKSLGAHVDLLPPSDAEIAQMIRLPARAAGLSFGVDPVSRARLDDVLCNGAVGRPDALPLLQHTLQELFRQRSDGGELGFDVLRRLGGMEGAIGRRAEEVVGGLSAPQCAALQRVLSLIVGLSGQDDSVTGRRAPWASLRTDAERDLVRALVEARLFVSELVGDEPGFGVAHEALLRRWPRVTAWIEEHRQELRVRARVAAQAARWTGEGRPADLLLPDGMQLEEARRLRRAEVFVLSEDEICLIDLSARRALRRARIRVGVLLAIVALGLAASVLAWSAFGAKRLAEQRRSDAEGLMGYMLGDFADKLRPLGRLDLLDSVSAKAMEYLAGPDAASLNRASLRQRAKALQVIAEVHVARGNASAALTALHAARAILLRQLDGAAGRAEVVKNLGANAFWQGQIHLDHGDWSQAERLFLKYQQYANQLYALDPSSTDAWIEQSYAHTNLGLLALKRDNPRRAAQQFDASITLKTRALRSRGHDRALAAELANSLSWLGSAHETLGSLEEANRIFGRELQVLAQLQAAAPEDFLWTTRMAYALQRRARLDVARGQDRRALETLTQAGQLMARVRERDPNNRSWHASHAIVELDRLRALGARDGAATVVPALTALAASAAGLTRLDPAKSDWARLSALTNAAIGLALLERKQPDAARAALADAVRLLETVQRTNPSDLRIRVELARTWLAMADLERATGPAPAAQASCGRAAALIGARATDSHEYRLLDAWVRVQLCLGNEDIVATAMQRLDRIGYQDTSYRRFVAHHQKGKYHVK